MTSSWFLVVLAVCAATVGAQSPAGKPEAAVVVNIQKTDGDLQTLVEQLTARVEKLEAEREVRDKSQVAFLASLSTTEEWTTQGPYTIPTTLLFQKVTTNIGDGYKADTGIFTAPVKGLYYIRFTGYVGSSGSINASLIKNGVGVVEIFDSRGQSGSASNGMPLVLEVGDRVSVTLWGTTSITDKNRFSTFSGFLVFPM